MPCQQFVERHRLGVRLVQRPGHFRERRLRFRQVVQPDQFEPFGALGKVDLGHQVEQRRFLLGKVERFREQPALEEGVAFPQTVVALPAEGAVIGRELLQFGSAGLLFGLDAKANLVNERLGVAKAGCGKLRVRLWANVD